LITIKQHHLQTFWNKQTLVMCTSIWLAGKECPQLLGHAVTRHSHSFSTWVCKYRRWTDIPQEDSCVQAWSSYGQSWIWLINEPLVMISEHPLPALGHAHSTNKHSFKSQEKLPPFVSQEYSVSVDQLLLDSWICILNELQPMDKYNPCKKYGHLNRISLDSWQLIT
jgi:hypothetical protein